MAVSRRHCTGRARQEIAAHRKAVAALPIEELAGVAMALISVFRKGGRLFLAGNGGSATMAAHIAAEFVGRFRRERFGWPAMALTDSAILTAVSNDLGFERVFARSVEAWVREGDCFWVLTTSGRSKNIVAAMKRARVQKAVCVAMAPIETPVTQYASYVIPAPEGAKSSATQEVQLLAGHIICGLVEDALCE